MAKQKHNLRELDEGQLDAMYSFLKLQRKNTCTKEDVRMLKEHLDIIRQAMVQKTAGQRDTDPDTYVDFVEIGTYINFVVIEALQLRIYGGLDVLEEVLPNEERSERI